MISKENKVESDQASLAGKLHFASGTTEFGVMGSKHFEDNVVGIGSTGYLGDAACRLDGTWTFLEDGDIFGIAGHERDVPSPKPMEN
jgi:hypothetical protein